MEQLNRLWFARCLVGLALLWGMIHFLVQSYVAVESSWGLSERLLLFELQAALYTPVAIVISEWMICGRICIFSERQPTIDEKSI